MPTLRQVIPPAHTALRLLSLWLLLGAAGCTTTSHPGARIVFGSEDLSGWREPTGEWTVARAVPLDAADEKKFVLQPGTGVLVNGAKGRTVNLLSDCEHGDVEAHLEFCVPKGSNSGVYFQGRYEVQILDSWGVEQPKSGDCGGLYASCSEPKPDWPGRPPSVNASKPPGAWQSFDVIFRAPRVDASGKKIAPAKFIKVVHNGKVIHEDVEVPRPTCAAAWLDEKPLGPLMLQGDHGPVAYRNLWLKPLKLE
ncbi:MAG: DUF1080 domain-containing protein [Verrucomicrobia bacterium]|nr:DUF1080 domain-containing protein [Verrucomicrobiota bacterium]